MFKVLTFNLVLLPLIGLIIKRVNCSNQVLNKPVILVPLMRYDTGKRQVLAFDTSSQLQLNNLNGLNDAIKDAVNMILNLEKETDQKSAQNLDNQINSYKDIHQQVIEDNLQKEERPFDEQKKMNDMNQQNHENMNNMMNNMMDNMMNNQPNYNNMNKMNQKNIYMQIPNSKPLYNDKNEFYMTNQNDNQFNLNQNENQVNNYRDQNYMMDQNYMNNQNYMMNNENYMINNQKYMKNDQNDYLFKTQTENQYKKNSMIKNNLNMNEMAYLDKNRPMLNSRDQLDRNQRYIKKLICRNRRHNRALRSKFYQSGSNSHANYDLKNGFSSFNSDFNGFNSIYSPDLIRYPVYVSEYDNDLINRLYSMGNIFI